MKHLHQPAGSWFHSKKPASARDIYDFNSMGYSKLAMVEGFVLCLVTMTSMEVTLGAAAGVFKFKPPPAMYVFGDSTLDVGNNNYLPGTNVPRANRPYYGVDFPGGVATGRFSNGYNTADFIAKCIGLVSSPPPYLSLVAPASSGGLLVPTALTIGVSYASGGAGILDSTNAGRTIPLSKQVHYFNATRSKMIAAADWAGSSDAVDTQINRSLILILIGGNDLLAFANAEQAQNRSGADLQSDRAAFYGNLISNYSAAIRSLYALGARRLAVVNVGLAGCLPVARVLDATGACAEDRNRLAAGFNAALRSLLAELTASPSSGMPCLAYSLADSLGLMADTFADPLASGFTDVADACCGGGRLGAEAACAPNATLCADRGQYYFWDNIHPTERAAALRAQAFYDGLAQYTTPINFKQLVHMSC